MAPLARLPVFLALDGRRAVVAGNGAAAAWKAELVSAAGAAVDVYAEHPCEELRALAADPPRGAVALHGNVAARAHERGGEVRVSLTHTHTTAGAVAIVG